MRYTFSVSPDFSPERLSEWFVFNTWLQRRMELPFHLQLMDGFDGLHEAVTADGVDLIYANPYDAALLVRDKGFTALVRPRGGADEALIATGDDTVSALEDLKPGTTLASTDDPAVHLMGMMLLEPAGLSRENTNIQVCANYVTVAKKLVRGESRAGIFLDRAFDEMSALVRSRLKVLVRSDIQVIHHLLMGGPNLKDHLDRLRQILVAMAEEASGRTILGNLGISAWEVLTEEEVEFMIDLMETLKYSPA